MAKRQVTLKVLTGHSPALYKVITARNTLQVTPGRHITIEHVELLMTQGVEVVVR